MDAQNWLLVIGGVTGLVTVIGGQIILIIKAMKADDRREQIAQAIIDPNVTTLPPKAS